MACNPYGSVPCLLAGCPYSGFCVWSPLTLTVSLRCKPRGHPPSVVPTRLLVRRGTKPHPETVGCGTRLWPATRPVDANENPGRGIAPRGLYVNGADNRRSFVNDLKQSPGRCNRPLVGPGTIAHLQT